MAAALPNTADGAIKSRALAYLALVKTINAHRRGADFVQNFLIGLDSIASDSRIALTRLLVAQKRLWHLRSG